jgi:hypothetical protein
MTTIACGVLTAFNQLQMIFSDQQDEEHASDLKGMKHRSRPNKDSNQKPLEYKSRHKRIRLKGGHYALNKRQSFALFILKHS